MPESGRRLVLGLNPENILVARRAMDALYQLCGEGYFPTLGLRVLRGRVLSEVEVNDARKVAW
jgi:hypothetical protein